MEVPVKIGIMNFSLRSASPPVLILFVAISACVPLASQRRPSALPGSNTKDWGLYQSQKFGIELRYPPNWKVIEHKGYVGFRNPVWDNPSWPLGGSSVTVQVWRDVNKTKALAYANIETQEQARRNGDKPIGGFGHARYIILLGAAGPPMPLKETTIAGLPALVAEVPTRVYHGNANESSGYAGAGDGKVTFLMAPHAYALFYATIYYKAFDAMVRSFRFTR